MSRQSRISDVLQAIATKLNTLKTQLDNLGSGGTQYFEQIIWAEENGNVSANQHEWSYGNGATGSNIGIPSFWNCEAVGMVLNAETFGTSATVSLRVNSVSVESITATQRDNFVDFTAPVAISRGNRISFYTNTVSGSWNDVRVGVVLRIPIIS